MKIEDIAFHEVVVQDEYVMHEAVVRNDFAWIGLASDERYHSVRVQFDTYKDHVKVWVDDGRYSHPPTIARDYTGYSKSQLKHLSMREVLDWLLI